MSGRSSSSLHITKLDASKRQLEAAIRMYFHFGDPVAIHTLTAAGYNVIRDLVRVRGQERMLVKDMIFDSVRPERVKELRDRLNAAENFFKHADKDPDGVLKFNPGQSEFLLLDACNHYCRLTGEWPPLFWLFFSWFSASNPEIYNLTPEQRDVMHRSAPDILAMGRTRFFSEMLPLVMAM